jgi:RimJ/RimL family protein N-acetyltransferase
MKPIARTARLELVAATLEIATADLHRRDRLPRLLRAELGEGWPPSLYDARAMDWVKRAMEADPALGAWTTWYWILKRPRRVIGISGFKGRPAQGCVEVGYTVLERYQRRGFATEAVTAMVQWAFAHGANCVIAETLPELAASRRVLAKCGFVLTGEGSEPGVLRFARERATLSAQGTRCSR